MSIVTMYSGMCGGSERLSERIVEAVATARHTDPIHLESLHERIDPDALEALFQRTADGSPATAGSVQFDYAEKAVSVYSDGTVYVSDSGPQVPGAETDTERVPGR